MSIRSVVTVVGFLVGSIGGGLGCESSPVNHKTPALDATADTEAVDASDPGQPDATTRDTSDSGGDSAGQRALFYLEAEDGDVTAPFAIDTDAQASRGRYVSASGVPNTSEPQVAVTHRVNLADGGEWHLWVRLFAPSGDQDAVYVGLAQDLQRVYPASPGAYLWVQVPGPHDVDAGEHTISVGHAEAGARVDAFVLTDDATYTPSGIPDAECGNGWVEAPETCEGDSACCDAATCIETDGCNPVVVLEHKKGFPDLWGEGADAISGGSGPDGVKFFITSLDDTDTAREISDSDNVKPYYVGTLRGAMNLPMKRHIIPRVSGNVTLTDKLRVEGGNRGDFTYHGHLAPRGGLTVTNDGLSISNNDNFVIRHLRQRFGPHSELSRDDVVFLNRNNRLAIDHCSFAWGADETFTIGGAIDSTYVDVIAQNNLIAQSREGHNTGSLIGWTSEGDNANGVVSWHHNVYVGVTHRTPNFAGDSQMFGRIYNNVVYDWSHRLTNVIGAAQVDVGYNYYKMGPFSPNVPASNYNQYQDLRWARPYPPSLWSAGNIMPGVMEDPAADNQALWTYFATSDPVDPSLFRDTPLPIDPDVGHQPIPARQAYQRNVVAKEAGANRSTDVQGHPVVGHDSVDEHYLTSIVDVSASRLDESQWNHPAVPSSPAYDDANWNGIADNFEAAHGIDSADQVITEWSFDGYRVVNNAGYDAFEIYSAWVAGDFERMAANQP